MVMVKKAADITQSWMTHQACTSHLQKPVRAAASCNDCVLGFDLS